MQWLDSRSIGPNVLLRLRHHLGPVLILAQWPAVLGQGDTVAQPVVMPQVGARRRPGGLSLLGEVPVAEGCKETRYETHGSARESGRRA
jgi:hypothetical protein